MIPLRRTRSKALPLLLLLALQVASAQAFAEAMFKGYKPLEQASDQFGAEISLLLDDERVRTMPGAEDPAVFDLWKRGFDAAALRRENRVFRGSGGVSAQNRYKGFAPAFLDLETGVVYRACFADGRPAPMHLLEGLPAEVVVDRHASGTWGR